MQDYNVSVYIILHVFKLDEVEFEFPDWVQAKATSDKAIRGDQPSFPLFVDICK